MQTILILTTALACGFAAMATVTMRNLRVILNGKRRSLSEYKDRSAVLENEITILLDHIDTLETRLGTRGAWNRELPEGWNVHSDANGLFKVANCNGTFEAWTFTREGAVALAASIANRAQVAS